MEVEASTAIAEKWNAETADIAGGRRIRRVAACIATALVRTESMRSAHEHTRNAQAVKPSCPWVSVYPYLDHHTIEARP